MRLPVTKMIIPRWEAILPSLSPKIIPLPKTPTEGMQRHQRPSIRVQVKCNLILLSKNKDGQNNRAL